MLLYRHEYRMTGRLDSSVEVLKFEVIKETQCGYWFIPSWVFSIPASEIERYKRWVSKTAHRRYAYPTIEESERAFIWRCNSHLHHLRNRILAVELALESIPDDSVNYGHVRKKSILHKGDFHTLLDCY